MLLSMSVLSKPTIKKNFEMLCLRTVKQYLYEVLLSLKFRYAYEKDNAEGTFRFCFFSFYI